MPQSGSCSKELPFGPASDDDEETRPDKNGMKFLQQTAKSPHDPVPEKDNLEQDDQLGDGDDDEMARLRSSSRYQKFEKMVGREKRDSKRERDESGEEDSAKRGRSDAYDIQVAIPVPDSLLHSRKSPPLSEPTRSIVDIDQSKMRPTKRRSRPKIDPKIIDDTDDSCSSESGNEDGDSKRTLGLPISQEAQFSSSHKSYITSICVDTAGVRMLSSSADGTVKFFDLTSMDWTLTQFQEISPCEDASVRGVLFSESGGRVLCWGDDSKLRVLDRDGKVILATKPGNNFIVDPSREQGHSGSLRGAAWLDTQRCASIGTDACVRFWDLQRSKPSAFREPPRMESLRLTKLRSAAGVYTRPQTIAHISDEKLVVGCEDGALHIVDSRSAREGKKTLALSNKADFTSLDVDRNGTHVLVRRTDSTMRLYDVRYIEKPLALIDNLPCKAADTRAVFLNDDASYFVTGTCAEGGRPSRLVFFERGSLQMVAEREMESDPIAIHWHPKINQIAVGRNDGSLSMFYDENVSVRGVLSCFTNKQRDPVEGMVHIGLGEIVTPGADEDEYKPKKKKTASEKRNEQNRKETEADQRHLQSHRAALLKHDEVTKRNPVFTKAYLQTQPKPVFAAKTAEQEQEETYRSAAKMNLDKSADRQ